MPGMRPSLSDFLVDTASINCLLRDFHDEAFRFVEVLSAAGRRQREQ
jgi:hypothetical protein